MGSRKLQNLTPRSTLEISLAKTINYLSSIKLVIGIFLLIKDKTLELLLSKVPSVKIFLGRQNPFK